MELTPEEIREDIIAQNITAHINAELKVIYIYKPKIINLQAAPWKFLLKYQVYKLIRCLLIALVNVQSYSGHTIHFFLCVRHLSTLTSAHHKQFHTIYIFSFIIVSSFLLKKKYMRFAFLFQFEEIGCRIASNACGGL